MGSPLVRLVQPPHRLGHLPLTSTRQTPLPPSPSRNQPLTLPLSLSSLPPSLSVIRAVFQQVSGPLVVVMSVSRSCLTPVTLQASPLSYRELCWGVETLENYKYHMFKNLHIIVKFAFIALYYSLTLIMP